MGKDQSETYQKVSDVMQNIWSKGRYYNRGDARFRSGVINLGKVSTGVKVLAGYSSEKFPDNTSRPTGPDTSYVSDYTPLVLGVTWTGYTEKIQDYMSVGIVPGWQPQDVSPEILAEFEVEDPPGNWQKINSLPLKKNWWQWIGCYPVTKKVRYSVEFDIPVNDPVGASLIDSPVFDDFTIYYKGGKIEFLAWVLV
jgi:hypothetical protein